MSRSRHKNPPALSPCPERRRMPAPTEGSPASRQNRLLAALSPQEHERLRPDLETISLTFKQPLHESDRPVEHVYFLCTGVASLLKAMADGRADRHGRTGGY